MVRFVRVAMIAALMVGASAWAQDASGPTPPAGQDSPKADKKPSGRLLRGDVLSVDIEAKTLTVQAKKGSELVSVVVETDRQTQFVLNDKAATLVDLRAGMKVTVLPDVGIATKVTAKSVKQPPKRTAGKSASPAKEGSAEQPDAKVGTPASDAKPQ